MKPAWRWTGTGRHIVVVGCLLLTMTACASDLGSEAVTATLKENETGIDRPTIDLTPQIGIKIATFALG